jgi:hypothetical protein
MSLILYNIKVYNQKMDYFPAPRPVTVVARHQPDLLWNKSQQLPEDVFRQLQTIYGDHFPIEARHHLAGKKRRKEFHFLSFIYI